MLDCVAESISSPECYTLKVSLFFCYGGSLKYSNLNNVTENVGQSIKFSLRNIKNSMSFAIVLSLGPGRFVQYFN